MRYMLLIYQDPAVELPAAEQEAEMGAWFAYSEALDKAGVLRAGDPLLGVEAATTVRVRDNQRLVTDGPFAETKEHLLGYYLIECEALDEALDWAAQVPSVGRGSIEVRPIMEIPGMDG